MTTISHNRRTKYPSLGAVIALLALLAVLGSVVLFRSQASAVLWKVISPIIAVRNVLDNTENSRLKAALASTTTLLADRNALYEENVQLKKQFGRSVFVHEVIAGVVSRPPMTPYDTLLIDAGSAQGVVLGQVVSAGGTTLIGRISEVNTDSARVTLFSAPGETYQALLRGSVPVSIEGQGGGSMRGAVPAGTRVSTGDTVVFPGIVSAFLGSVSRIEAKDGESFETIFLHLPINLFELRFVAVHIL